MSTSEETPLPTSLAQGVRGHGPVDATEARNTGVKPANTTADRYENDSVEARESLATFGEGEVATAEQRKSGTQRAPGQKGEVVFEDFASDLDR
jgi:hypothetical protein